MFTENWVPICQIDEIEPQWGEAVLLGKHQIAIFRLADNRLFAVSNTDPASGAQVISRGIVGSFQDRPTIISPLHKEVFDLETGRCYTDPQFSLNTWPIRQHAGMIEIAEPNELI